MNSSTTKNSKLTQRTKLESIGINRKMGGPIQGNKTAPKIFSFTDGNKLRQFNATSVPPIAPGTDDADHKHDMESIQPEEIKFATRISYTDIFPTEVLLKSDPRHSSPKS